MKTLAAVLTQLNQPLEIFELELPPLARGQVLVQMAFSGLCHTQLNEWRGTKGPDPYLPHTLGHEGSGIVIAVGEGVKKVKPGDHVVASWIKGEGLEASSTLYRCGEQTINSGPISTFLEKAIISENRLVPVSAKLSLKEDDLLGCAIPTGAGVVFNDMKIQEGQSIAVFGVGGIGSSALLAARHAKAYPIVAVDVHEEKLQKAQELGATHTLFAQDPMFREKLLALFDRKGADFALEAAGKKEAMELAFECVKAPGGLCVLAGNLPAGQRIQIDPFSLIKGKRVIGTWGGGARIDRDIPHFADIFLGAENTLKPLISDVVSLHQINELMEKLHQGRIARGLIEFPLHYPGLHA